MERDQHREKRPVLGIGELAARTGVSARSLRYYEQQGLLAPERTTGGRRIYRVDDERSVTQIQELLRAGFCSSVIRELLLPLASPAGSEELLRSAFSAARARLESEREAIESELSELAALEARIRVAPDTHVSTEDQQHDHFDQQFAPSAPFDHRDRRLR